MPDARQYEWFRLEGIKRGIIERPRKDRKGTPETSSVVLRTKGVSYVDRGGGDSSANRWNRDIACLHRNCFPQSNPSTNVCDTKRNLCGVNEPNKTNIAYRSPGLLYNIKTAYPLAKRTRLGA